MLEHLLLHEHLGVTPIAVVCACAAVVRHLCRLRDFSHGGRTEEEMLVKSGFCGMTTERGEMPAAIPAAIFPGPTNSPHEIGGEATNYN